MRLGLLISLVAWEVAYPPYGPPVAQACQTVKAETGGSAQQDQKPTQPPPTWPATIDDAEKASQSECGSPEECRAEQREYSDLKAQWQAAEAAKGQESFAVIQTWIAGAGTILALFGTIALIVTLGQSRRASIAGVEAAKAAFEANEINMKAMAADQRPWVSVTYEVGGPLEWTADGCNLQFVFWLENVGRSPARARFAVKTIPEPVNNAPALQLELTEHVRCGTRNALQATVFPSQKTRLNILETIPNAELAAAKERLNADWIFPTVIGCVDYQAAHDSASYQTGFIFHVGRVPKDGSAVIHPAMGNIPAADLLLVTGISARID